MVTTKRDEDDDKRYMVYSYSPSDKLYRISPLVNENDENSDNNDGHKTSASSSSDNLQRLSRLSLTVPSSDPTMQISYESDSLLECSSTDLVPSASAKFYPLLLELMKRGDQTAKATKAATTEFLAKKEVSNVINKATKFTQEQLEANQEKIISKAAKVTEQVTDNLNNPDEAVEDIAGKVKNAVNDDEVKQLMTMIKDEDLTLLLEKGKERLEKLLQKDIPEATELALSKTGIRIATDQNDPYRDAINQSRQMALKAMEELLQKTEVDANDLKAIQDSLGDNFHSMLDSLTQAAKSDRTLAKILDTVNEQTAEWQEMTGRLLQTKSASLFLEGASRIQSRAANLFTKNQLHWAGEVGSKLTKAFTEGDAAVARLKSIELGDSVRNRLVQAIEVRSESLGGLDGIIAGALTSFKSSSSGSGDQLKEMLTKLQSQATSSTKNTHETLISVLSHESEYRDVALLKVEQVLCDLESHLGEDLSPEDIAAFARGEGGTAKLFEPIAKRAAKEIEKQLDAAEASISDKTMMGVLKHVRKIVSGELTLTAVMDEVVNILNDDNVVAASKDLVKQGEQVLDALEGLEGVSGNKVVDDVMQIAEKAGITKDTVMEGIDKLDVNELLVRKCRLIYLVSLIDETKAAHRSLWHRTTQETPSQMRRLGGNYYLMLPIQRSISFYGFSHPCRFLRSMV